MPVPADISAQMAQALAAAEPDLDTSIGTPVRKILDTVAEAISEATIDRYLLQYTYDIDARSGADLDAFVALFGFSRVSARRAAGTVLISRNAPAASGTVIPAGSQLATGDSPPFIVQTTSAAVFPQSTLSIQVPVQAVVGGAVGNLPANSIVRWVNLIEGIAAVSNPAPLIGGADAESDEALRARFKKSIFRNLAGTEDMYLGIALSDIDVRSAIVLGAVEVWRERIQVAFGTATPVMGLADRLAPIAVNSVLSGSTTTIGMVRPHNLIVGDIVTISGVGGVPLANGTYRVTNVGSTTGIQIGPLNTTGELVSTGTYTSGGTVKFPLRASWIYDTGYVVGADIDNGDVLTPNVHYTLNTATNPPVLTVIDSTAMPDGIYDLSLRYVPRKTRSTPQLGIANKVDVWIDGTRVANATENVLVDGLKVFSNVSGNYLHQARWRRLDGSLPALGNLMIPLGFTPVVTPPTSFTITVPASTFILGTNAWLVRAADGNEGSAYAGDALEVAPGTDVQVSTLGITSSTNASPIELSIGAHNFKTGQRIKVSGHTTNTNANGIWTIQSITGTTVTLQGSTGNGVGGVSGTVSLLSPAVIDYTYNEIPRVVQEQTESWRMATSDVVVHEGKALPLKIYAAVILKSGYTLASVQTPVNNAVSTYLTSLGFGATMQVSDLLNVMGDVQGIDAVRLLKSSDIITYAMNGATATGPIVISTAAAHGIPAGAYKLVNVIGVNGNTAANGTWRATYASATTLTLEDSVANAAYTSGGFMVPIDFGVKVMAEDGLSDSFASLQIGQVLQIGSAEIRAADLVANDQEFFTLHSIVLTQKAQNTWGSI